MSLVGVMLAVVAVHLFIAAVAVERVQHFTNMVPEITQVNVGNVSGLVSGDGNVLVHGPLAKLTIEWPVASSRRSF